MTDPRIPLRDLNLHSATPHIRDTPEQIQARLSEKPSSDKLPPVRDKHGRPLAIVRTRRRPKDT